MRTYMHLKNEPGMLKAWEKLSELRAEVLPTLVVRSRSSRYNYELVEAFEVENMLDVAEMMVKASMMRKESRRHLFIREDYPHRDDHNWLKHIHIQKVDGQMTLTTVPVEFPYLRPDKTGVRPAR